MSGKPRVAPELGKPGLQPERTSLAWERTSLSMMLLGILLARIGETDGIWPITLVGLAQTVVGSALLVWAGFHYRSLHGPIQQGAGVVHPGAARAVGLVTVAFTAVALVVALRLIGK